MVPVHICTTVPPRVKQVIDNTYGIYLMLPSHSRRKCVWGGGSSWHLRYNLDKSYWTSYSITLLE